MSSTGNPDPISLVTIWPIALPEWREAGTPTRAQLVDSIGSITRWIDGLELQTGSGDSAALAARRVPPQELRFTADPAVVAAQYSGAPQLFGTDPAELPAEALSIVGICTSLLVLPKRGMVAITIVDIATDDLTDLIWAKKLMFDPAVSVSIRTAAPERAQRDLAEAMVDASATTPGHVHWLIDSMAPASIDTRGIELVHTAATEGVARSHRPGRDREPLVLPSQVVFAPTTNPLCDRLKKGALNALAGDEADHAVARIELLKLFFKDVEIEYEAEYARHALPPDGNAVAGLTVAVWDRDTLVLGLDSYAAYLANRGASILDASCKVRSALHFCEEATAIAELVHASESRDASAPAEAGGNSAEQSPDAALAAVRRDSLDLQSALSILGALKGYLESVAGSVVSLAAGSGGVPSRSVMNAMAQHINLENQAGRARQLLVDTMELVDIRQRKAALRAQNLQFQAQTDQQEKLKRILQGNDALRLVAVVFAVVVTAISVGSLWVATIAVPRVEEARFADIDDGIAFAMIVLGLGAAFGLALWFLTTPKAREYARQRSLKTGVLLLMGVIGLGLLMFLPPDKVLPGIGLAGARAWSIGLLIAAVVMFAVSIALIAAWIRQVLASEDST